MTVQMSDPTRRPIVLLHGSYHRPEHFSAFVRGLESAGHAVVVPDIGGRHLSAQIEIAQRAVRSVASAPVVVAHSFGGAAAGALDHVAHTIFLSAWVLDAGETCTDHLGPHGATEPAQAFTAALVPASDDGFLRIDPRAAPGLFYNRCPAAIAEHATSLLRPDAAANFFAAPSRARWRDTPTTYLRPSDDHTWPPALIDRFAGRANTTIEVDGADHSLWLSRPEEVARIVLDIAVQPSVPYG